MLYVVLRGGFCLILTLPSCLILSANFLRWIKGCWSKCLRDISTSAGALTWTKEARQHLEVTAKLRWGTSPSIPISYVHGKLMGWRRILQTALQGPYPGHVEVLEKLSDLSKCSQMNPFSSVLWLKYLSMLSLVGDFKMSKRIRSFMQTWGLTVTVQATRCCQRKMSTDPFPRGHRWLHWSIVLSWNRQSPVHLSRACLGTELLSVSVFQNGSFNSCYYLCV